MIQMNHESFAREFVHQGFNEVAVEFCDVNRDLVIWRQVRIQVFISDYIPISVGEKDKGVSFHLHKYKVNYTDNIKLIAIR